MRRHFHVVAMPVARACLLLTLSIAPACTCSRTAPLPAEVGQDFGSVAAPAPGAADIGPYLALARAVVEQRSPQPLPPAAAAAGRRVFLAFWPERGGVRGDAIVGSASGATLAAAVTAAANDLRARLGEGRDPRGGRLELDVASAVDGVELDGDQEVELPRVGLEGVFVVRDGSPGASILPGEVVSRALFHEGRPAHLDHDRIDHLLAERAKVGEADVRSMRAYRFGAASFIESPAHDGALPLFRGVVDATAEPTPEALLGAVRAGAEYLTRILNPQGRYVYLYRAATDRDDNSYGWLRHAGTTYALFEAYGELGVPDYLAKGERALAYLEAHLTSDPDSQGKYVLDTNDEEQQKVGGAGLALLAFTEHAAVTGDRAHLETMRALARFIISRQYEDGRYRANADLPALEGKQAMKKEPVYYVGEAALGLMRLYALDPQAAYLDSARRAGDWVLRVRDAVVSEDNQEHDHWISYAYNELYRVTRNEAYIQHAYKIARAITKRLHREGEAPARDWVGTFYEGQTTPGATRLEAYNADIALSRFAGRPDEWLLTPARTVAKSMLAQQYRADNGFWLPNLDKAAGGVRESLYVDDVRIDYVQHSMSAWLHLARILRDPTYGKSGVPSQDPVQMTAR
jgi:hypothetical protein